MGLLWAAELGVVSSGCPEVDRKVSFFRTTGLERSRCFGFFLWCTAAARCEAAPLLPVTILVSRSLDLRDEELSLSKAADKLILRLPT